MFAKLFIYALIAVAGLVLLGHLITPLIVFTGLRAPESAKYDLSALANSELSDSELPECRAPARLPAGV